ncbi:MAG: Trk family potassium uptake protein, partial [Erysipelotrichaceae bacterium]|nr:Trk family potassium uptake protein [Erysipelotrichaceae bacterium]
IFGALFLMLPICNQQGVRTSFLDALFTATSATCVTGLVVKDTASYWNGLGQVIILILIQIGGLGVITMISTMYMLTGRRLSLLHRHTMQESIAAPKLSGMVRFTRFILKGTFLFEGIGCILLCLVFVPENGLLGIWQALFHSISAFCNAGFDVLGTKAHPFVSFTPYAFNSILNLTIMFMVIFGGLGYMTWDDMRSHKWCIHRYCLQTKMIIATTFFLLVIPAIIFFLFEFKDQPIQERFWYSAFQSVTPRTAGFNTVDYANMSDSSLLITMLLMLVGGSPGSTAGGLKTTTFAVLVFNVIATFRQKRDVECFGRRISHHVIGTASTILMFYLMAWMSSAIVISMIEDISVKTCLFETASAIGTVGLTMGITPQLSSMSRVILIGLMFLGRTGGLTLVYATLSENKKTKRRYPKGQVSVG